MVAGQAAIAIENARLYALAICDGLTGLSHQSHFRERLAVEVNRAHWYRRPLALMMLDVDHFKQVNDAEGHLVGDSVLRAVAREVEQGLRSSDLVARCGGDEFAILLVETGSDHGVGIAERLQRMIGELTIDNRALSATEVTDLFDPQR
jgi:diguanylate cyclase (GGDEF)-like protein